MAQYVYVQPFGKFKAGDVVDLPDGASAPAQFLVPVKGGNTSPPVDPAKADAALAAAKEALADAEAADAAAHEEGAK